MIISRKKYEADLEREYEKGRYEAFRQVDEDHAERAKKEEIKRLWERLLKLEHDMEHGNRRCERSDEKKRYADVIPAAPQGVPCPPDRLDI